jgi:TRAP-type C4-dicarboxylate transport system permease large subunit
MVLYGVIANASVGSLFLAGIVPGFLTAGVLMIQVYFWARKRRMPRYPRASPRELWTSFKRASLALVTPVIIIMGGIFTPTEAAAVAALYSLALGLFILVAQVIVTYWPGLILFRLRLARAREPAPG